MKGRVFVVKLQVYKAINKIAANVLGSAGLCPSNGYLGGELRYGLNWAVQSIKTEVVTVFGL